MSEEKSQAMEFATTVGEAVENAAKEGVGPETVVIALGYHIGNILRHCEDPNIMTRVLGAIQEINNDHVDATKIVVDSASSGKEAQQKLTALKDKPKGDIH